MPKETARKNSPCFTNLRSYDVFSYRSTSEDAFFGPATIQPKLTIGQPNDKYEKEATSMAARVTNMNLQIAPPSNFGSLNKSVGANKPDIQKRNEVSTGKQKSSVASPQLVSKLEASKDSGQKLPARTNSSMSRAFGTDFSGVRVHTGGSAVQMSRDLGAIAFTHGSDIYFNRGAFNPHSIQGKHLLAHELTHVVQQAGIQRKKIQRACVGGRWRFEYDGCSLPSGITRRIGLDKDNPAGGRDTHFANVSRTGACDKHDECYQTCNRSRNGRAVCDRAMLANMRRTCRLSTETPAVKARCFRWANVYYRGLRWLGYWAWRGRQNQVCRC